MRQNIPNKLSKINKKYSNDCNIVSDRKYDTENVKTNRVAKSARNFVITIKLSLQKLKSKKKNRLLKNT